MMRRRLSAKRGGFFFMELLLATMFAAIASVAVIALVSQTFSYFRRPTMDRGGVAYGVSPDPSSFAKAVQFHQRLRTALDARSHFIVLGGAGQLPSGATTAVASSPRPLLESWATSSLTWTVPGAAQVTPAALAATPACSGSMENANSADNFTVVVFQGNSTVSAVAQCRKESDGTYNYYRCTLRDGGSLARLCQYTYAIRVDRDSFAMPPGATTYWQGDYSASAWHRFAAPQYRLVFPDPALTANAKVEPYSQFTYFENGIR